MKYTMKKFLYTALSITLLLSLAACAKQPASQGPQPESSPADQSAAVSEAAPQESKAEHPTYQVPIFGIEFDCPADFASDVISNIVSEDEVYFSVNGEAGDRTVSFTCSRIASLKDDVALAALAGVDSTALYEDYQSLDVTAAIASWKEYWYETFELLDSFSTPDSYGFYFAGKNLLRDTDSTELWYVYKNYGGFGEPNDLIRVDLEIGTPESMGRDDFIALCEAVTNSLRLSEGGASAADAAPSAELGGDFEVGGSFDAALEPLKGGAYEEQCREIVDRFFQYAPLVRRGASSSDLMLLMNGNVDLFKMLAEPGEILCGPDSFTSELAIQDCGQNLAGYYINVIETRYYDDDEMGTVEYAYTFDVSINSPTDYCITGIADQFLGQWGSTGTPADGEYGGADSSYDSSQSYGSDELAMQHSYGANARVDQHTFSNAIWGIRSGDYQLAGYNPWGAYTAYLRACEELENRGYTDTPLYDLALQRLALAQNQVDIEEAIRRGSW